MILLKIKFSLVFNSLKISLLCCWKYLLSPSFSISLTTSAIRLSDSTLNWILCCLLSYLPWIRCLFTFAFIACMIVSAPFKAGEYEGMVRSDISFLLAYWSTFLVLWIEALSIHKKFYHCSFWIIYYDVSVSNQENMWRSLLYLHFHLP